MKMPKIIRRYCKFCKKHTEQTVSQMRRKDRGPLKKGSIQRAKKRGLGIGHGNLGRWGSKPTNPKMTGKKASKKSSLKYTCKECKKTMPQLKTFRAKKVELI